MMPSTQLRQVVEEGPLYAALEVSYQLTPKSTMKQKIALTALSPRLDFTCEVDWHENREILVRPTLESHRPVQAGCPMCLGTQKVEFPVDIESAEVRILSRKRTVGDVGWIED